MLRRPVLFMSSACGLAAGALLLATSAGELVKGPPVRAMGQPFPNQSAAASSRFSIAQYAANGPIEDRFSVKEGTSGNVVHFAVMDGHGGWQVSDYLRSQLLRSVVNSTGGRWFSDPEKQLQSVYKAVDDELMARIAPSFRLGFGGVARAGSCAISLHCDGSQVVVANTGDCRAVLGRVVVKEEGTAAIESAGEDAVRAVSVEAVALSTDHSSNSVDEQARLRKEHPGEEDIVICRHSSACYVKGKLMPTRSFGDFYLKHSEFNNPNRGVRSAGKHVREPNSFPYITAEPEVRQFQLQREKGDSFIIVASDGIWDELSNEEAANVVAQYADGDAAKRERAAQALVDAALARAAMQVGVSPVRLRMLSPGRDRRRIHDDMTVVVYWV